MEYEEMYNELAKQAEAQIESLKRDVTYHKTQSDLAMNKAFETNRHLKNLAELLFEYEEAGKIDLEDTVSTVRKALIASGVGESQKTQNLTIRIVREATVEVEITRPRWNEDGSEFDASDMDAHDFQSEIEEEVNNNTYDSEWDTTELEIVTVND